MSRAPRRPTRGWGSHLWLPIAIPGGRTHHAIRVARTPSHGPGHFTRCGIFVPAGRGRPGDRVDCGNCA